jgi:hypothetical protein
MLGWRFRGAWRHRLIKCAHGQERSALCFGYSGQARDIEAFIAPIGS